MDSPIIEKPKLLFSGGQYKAVQTSLDISARPRRCRLNLTTGARGKFGQCTTTKEQKNNGTDVEILRMKYKL